MNWFKRALKRYDDWCKELGLTPGQKRSCVPHRLDPTLQKEDQKKRPLSADEIEKIESEAL